MLEILQRFAVQHEYRVIFTRQAFDPANRVLRDLFSGGPHRAIFAVDSGLAAADPTLVARVQAYAASPDSGLVLAAAPLVLQGGEQGKQSSACVDRLVAEIAAAGLCRHSYVVAIGGGALLDLAGFAAAIAHRGIRLVRMPSTVLAQNDAGVGVKNGINWNGRKNFLGCFAPPAAVVNDIDLLRTLPPRERRAGLAEAVKVALIHDAAFFVELERDRAELALGTEDATERAIRRCAALHLNHIATGGDPFELGSARPLDFGHWSAHRLEEMTAGGLRHGEAVAIGMALDAGYACRAGLLSQDEHGRILTLIAGLGLPLCHPELLRLDVPAALASFREHLGGELTITLPRGIGRGIEVHDIDTDAVRACIADLASIPGAGGAAGARSLARGGSHVADPLPTVRRGGSPGVLPREPLACARAGSLLGPAGPEP